MIRRLNKALPSLLCGIIGYGLLVQLVGVWFVEDKLRYSSGLWIGIILAVGMAIHMAVVIEDTVTIYGEQGAKSRVITQSILRYLVILIVFLLTAKFELGNILMTFIGVMGLKASAYLQTLVNKFTNHHKGEYEQGGEGNEQ